MEGRDTTVRGPTGTDFRAALASKASDAYAYYAGDFSDARLLQWTSVWYQAREAILDPQVRSVLEFGPGRGVTRALLEHFGLRHVGVDVNQDFCPDVVSSIADYEGSETFDMVCAFQVLEHNPFELVPSYLEKLRAHTGRYLYLSLPFSGRWFSVHVNVNLPRFSLPTKTFTVTWPRWRKVRRPLEQYRRRKDSYNPHWWEVGDRETPVKRVRSTIESAGFLIRKEFNNPLFPYHIFFLAECR